jgi:hypothetical protein
MEVRGQLQGATALTPGGKALGIHCVDGWVGLEPVWKLWSREKSIAPVGNITLVVQSIARRYTDRDIPVPFLYVKGPN